MTKGLAVCQGPALASNHRAVGKLPANAGLRRHWLPGEARAVRGATARD